MAPMTLVVVLEGSLREASSVAREDRPERAALLIFDLR
jgi:hypothetical protein